MRRVFHLVNGIDTFPGCSTNWNGRAVTHIHTRSDARAEKIEYFCGPIGRAFGQRNRAHKLFRTVSYYRGWGNILVGHSNGADVILRMMRDHYNWPPITHLHLVCGACNSDFEKNGINEWLKRGRIDRVTVYVAGRDRALALAHTWIGKLLGYGTLGLRGPENVAREVQSRVRTVWEGPWKNFGHSTCWDDRHFVHTMDALLHD